MLISAKKKRKLYKFMNRIRLRNKNFSLIASNCNGMFILKDLNLPYKSPFVNLWLYPNDFLKFLTNIEYYLPLTLNFVEKPGIQYPVAELGDITIYFQHFSSAQEAREKMEQKNTAHKHAKHVYHDDGPRWLHR